MGARNDLWEGPNAKPAMYGRARQWTALLPRYLNRALLYATVLFGGGMLLIPYLWMLSAALKEERQIFAVPPIWIPRPIVWANFPDALASLPFDRFLLNTVCITALTIVGQIGSCSLAGYSFARIRFRLRDPLFMLVLSTTMLPYTVSMIPQFILWRYLGFVDTYVPLIAPAYLGGSAYYIFLFRQFFMTLSVELEDAARIDGAGTFTCYARVILPLAKPVIGAVAIFSFMAGWNDFMGPMIYLNSMKNYTLSIGLNMLRVAQGGMRWSHLMAASFAVMTPCLVVFFCFQRVFIQGIVYTGIKG